MGSFDLVTAHKGTAHVSADNQGTFNACIFGKDSYVISPTLPAPFMADANTVNLPPCTLLLQGRHAELVGVNTVSIKSGSQSGTRTDLIYARLTHDNETGVDDVSLGVVTGTGGTADPALPYPANFADGASIADIAIARVVVNGLTPTVTWLLPQLPTIEAMSNKIVTLESGLQASRDSISQMVIDISNEFVIKYAYAWRRDAVNAYLINGKFVMFNIRLTRYGSSTTVNQSVSETLVTFPSKYNPANYLTFPTNWTNETNQFYVGNNEIGLIDTHRTRSYNIGDFFNGNFMFPLRTPLF